MKKIFLLSILSIVLTGEVNAQFYSTQYRTPGQEWRQIQTERFRVIFPARYEAKARETLTILELEYDDIQQLVGGDLRDFPVILNPENDRSNGFVSPINFRSEIEIAPFLGKALNPRSGNWLESVVPHELVHALHFSVNTPSIVSPLGLFAPDLRRSIHAAAAFGFIEGIAVEHETHNTLTDPGRGNYPYFNNQFRAMQGADDPWSMSQLVQTTTYTPPFNRHYIGGYKFVNWLQENEGDEAMKDAIRRHYQLPFFGFGFALRRTTGKWPGRLYREFMEEQDRNHRALIEGVEEDTDINSGEISFNATCRRANRPVWISETELLFFGRSCNRPAGFYIHDLESRQTSFFHEVSITGDNHYSLSPDGTSLIYSRFHTSPMYDNSFLADLHSVSLENRSHRRITRGQRVVAPGHWNNQILAAQTDGQTRSLVVIEPQSGDIIKKYPNSENSTVVLAVPSPQSDSPAAILGKKHGVQAIWFEDLAEADTLFNRSPDIIFESASIFDPSWSTIGDRLTFTADPGSSMNIYEYEIETGQIRQLTDSRYLAMEGSLSPDGGTLAYITQQKNEQLPVLLSQSDYYDTDIPESDWGVTDRVKESLDRPLLNRPESEDESEISGLEALEYSTGLGWLKPRIWMPAFESRINDFDELGISLESVDRMSRHAYSLEFTHFRKAFWFDGTYRYTGAYPGFELNAFNRPSVSTFQISPENEDPFLFRTVAQRRGATLSVPFRYRIEQNTRFSSLFIEPEFSLTQIRFKDFNDASQPISDYEQPLYTLGLNTTLNLGLRQHTRDVQPNRGLQLFTQTRYGLNSSEFTIQVPGGASTNPISQRRGFRAGAIWYVAPLSRYNQSLRISAQGFTQTTGLVFDTQSVISNLFDPAPVPTATNTGILDTRYTIPLIYPDDGGMLLPVYLSNIYLVLFSQTVSDLDAVQQSTRTVLGAGIRSKFKIGNTLLDLGIAIGWEPAGNRVDYLFGSF